LDRIRGKPNRRRERDSSPPPPAATYVRERDRCRDEDEQGETRSEWNTTFYSIDLISFDEKERKK